MMVALRCISVGLMMFALTSCSVSVGGSDLNTDALEDEIVTGIQEQADVAVTVDCPDDIKIEEGNEFTCTAEDDQGTTHTIDITQDDDEGNVSWEVRE